MFGEFGQENTRPSTVVHNVQKSMKGMGTNLLGVLSFGVEFSHFIDSEHNPSEYKYIPLEADIKSFKLITENPFIIQLSETEEMKEYLIKPTFDSNWLTTKGENIDKFEKQIENYERE